MINLKNYIREIPNWPKNGVNFKDITPLLLNSKVFRYACQRLVKPFLKKKIDIVVGIDARGFIFSAVLAYLLKAGLAIIRKRGKLPWKVIRKKYTLEYASNTIEMHKDAIKKGQRVLLIDDVLATGGTMKATIDLVEKMGGQIVGIAFLATLSFLEGEKKLKGYKIHKLVTYQK